MSEHGLVRPLGLAMAVAGGDPRLPPRPALSIYGAPAAGCSALIAAG